MCVFPRSDQKTPERAVQEKQAAEESRQRIFAPDSGKASFHVVPPSADVREAVSPSTGAGQRFCDKYQVLDNGEITNPEQTNQKVS